MSNEVHIIFYYYKAEHGGKVESDRAFTGKRMAVIPASEKMRVKIEYERIFRSGIDDYRGIANTYLHNEAVKYRQK